MNSGGSVMQRVRFSALSAFTVLATCWPGISHAAHCPGTPDCPAAAFGQGVVETYVAPVAHKVEGEKRAVERTQAGGAQTVVRAHAMSENIDPIPFSPAESLDMENGHLSSRIVFRG